MIIHTLIWDEWNKKHITAHHVSRREIEEVCHRKYQVKESYRKRLVIIGQTKAKRTLVIVFSPEDRNLKAYESGVYYIITAFERKESI